MKFGHMEAGCMNRFWGNFDGKMPLNLWDICMETVVMVTPVTCQMHGQVALRRWVQYSCNEIYVVRWHHKRQHVYRKTVFTARAGALVFTSALEVILRRSAV